MAEKNMDRRAFMGAAAATAGAVGITLAACSGKNGTAEGKFSPVALPEFQDQAPDGKPLSAGLIGCGGRGTGAAMDFLNSGPNLTVTALADVFDDRVQSCRARLAKDKNNEVPADRCFVGFDAYKKLLDLDVDVVLMATPPKFRPEHFAACVEARKHVFMEKPMAVDPVGARSIMASSKKAEAADLSVVTGTQRRHQRDYNGTYAQIKAGAIGDIVSANCYWNQSKLWHRDREAGWSDMEFMIRDWVNWCWLSGDHIVEQHVHNLDVIHWFTGKHPVKAVGFGGRHRRPTGDQYDFFSVDYVYDDKMHVHSMCRQINGCINNVSEFVMGTKGFSNCCNTIYDASGQKIWEYPYPKDEKGERVGELSPYVQEHVDLVTAIRTHKHIVEAETTAISTLVAIMGRISAYTGKEVTYEDMMGSDLEIGPKDYAMATVDVKAEPPVPGTGG
jgi:predicted dehydrogenase